MRQQETLFLVSTLDPLYAILALIATSNLCHRKFQEFIVSSSNVDKSAQATPIGGMCHILNKNLLKLVIDEWMMMTPRY